VRQQQTEAPITGPGKRGVSPPPLEADKGGATARPWAKVELLGNTRLLQAVFGRDPAFPCTRSEVQLKTHKGCSPVASAPVDVWGLCQPTRVEVHELQVPACLVPLVSVPEPTAI
jgi:hypothetical protein